MLLWQPGIVCCLTYDALSLTYLANKFSLLCTCLMIGVRLHTPVTELTVTTHSTVVVLRVIVLV